MQLTNWLKREFWSEPKNWLKFSVIVFLILPSIPFILGSALVLVYIYWPINYDELTLPALDADAQHTVVIAHGLKDNSASWSDPLQSQLARQDPQQQIISVNWESYARNPFRCSIDARRIGRHLGQQLLAQETLRSLHLIGHSCGSFLVLGVCETLKAARPELLVQSTYLDPVTIYGGLFWDYGLTHFGSCADYSEAYIDTEDAVPGSNQLLPLAHTFDVTALRKPEFTQSPHLWPTYYYLDRAEHGELLELRRDETISGRYPAGEMFHYTP